MGRGGSILNAWNTAVSIYYLSFNYLNQGVGL